MNIKLEVDGCKQLRYICSVLKLLILSCLLHSSFGVERSNTDNPETISVSDIGTVTEGVSESCFNESCGCLYNPEGPLVRCDFL